MTQRSIRIVLLSGALFLAGAFTGQAGALSPVPPQAEVVFANGGRVLAMKADGSDRRVLFGKQRRPTNGEAGAIDPVVSPDGSAIAFGFRRHTIGRHLTDIWLMNGDGTNPRRIRVSRPNHAFGDPAFMPNGRLAVAYFRQAGRVARTGLISFDSDGTGPKTMFELRRKRRPYTLPLTVAKPDFSADGSKLLYVLKETESDFTDPGFENPLMVRDRATGRTVKLVGDAYDGAFSPDGKRIVYSAQTRDDDLELCWWEAGCRFQSALAVINSDGSGRRMLTGRQLDERSPDWSERNRIVFQSARNMPGVGEASEVFSIQPDGKCLTLLTNGSPASLTPSWSGRVHGNDRPVACGAMPPYTGVEVGVPPRVRSNDGIFWLGPAHGTRLLSDVYTDEGGAFFLYLDCVRQQRSQCNPPAGFWSLDMCFYRGQIAGAFSDGPPIRRQRGVPVFRSTGSEMGPFGYVAAGRSLSFFFGGSGRGANLGRLEIEAMRGVNAPVPEGNLPAVRFPSFDIRLMKKVARSYKVTGSVAKSARRLGLRPGNVRNSLRFSRMIKAFGSYGTVNCPRGRGS